MLIGFSPYEEMDVSSLFDSPKRRVNNVSCVRYTQMRHHCANNLLTRLKRPFTT